MRNKIKFISGVLFSVFMFMPMYVFAADAETDVAASDDVDISAQMEAVSADAVAAYNPAGSVFQQITDLEQEKVLMELEKERAQLDLELDRLAAEKIKLHMEIDELSGRAEQQQQELENAQAKLETEAARLEREKEEIEAQTEELEARRATYTAVTSAPATTTEVAAPAVNFDDQYRLVNVIGAGSQLQATIENLSTGQNKTISVGKVVDGYTVQSISLDDGVVFSNGADVQALNVSKSN